MNDAMASPGRYRDIIFTGAAASRTSVVLPPIQTHAPRAVAERTCPGEAEGFIRLLLESCGSQHEHYRVEPLLRRIPSCLRRLRVKTLSAAVTAVTVDERLRSDALNGLLIGVTSFFRDPLIWDELRANVLPMLLRNREKINACSVACSDGAELYSLEMLLHEGDRPVAGRLLGTDCRRAPIEMAESGRYSAEACRGIPAELRQRFTRTLHSGDVQIINELRMGAQWRVEDAVSSPVQDRFDLVLCRNLAIYLRRDASDLLWRRLHSLLSPGGVLVVGKAEKPEAAAFRRIGPCCFQRQEAS